MADVLGVPRGVSHHEVAAPRMTQQINRLSAEMRADGIEVVDLVGERARLALRERAGAAVAALVVKHDAAFLGESLPCGDAAGNGCMFVGMVEPRAAVHDD